MKKIFCTTSLKLKGSCIKNRIGRMNARLKLIFGLSKWENKMSRSDKSIVDRLISLYVESDVTEGTRDKFLLFLGEDIHLEEKDKALRKFWSTLDKPATQNTYEALERMKIRLNMPVGNKRKTSLHNIIIRVAAVLIPVIGLVGAHLWFNGAVEPTEETITNNITVLVPAGKLEHIILSDGSEIWLRGGSKITYLREFTEERGVILEGEAYFKVTRNEKPFVVKAYDVVTRVLGTEFNVSAFSDERKVTVTLEKGLVETQVGNKTYFLKKGEQLEYDQETESVKLETIPGTDISDWTTGVLSFDKNALDEIFRIIERHYGVHITADKKIPHDQLYTTRFEEGTPVEQALYVLETLTGLFTFEIVDNEVLITLID